MSLVSFCLLLLSTINSVSVSLYNDQGKGLIKHVGDLNQFSWPLPPFWIRAPCSNWHRGLCRGVLPQAPWPLEVEGGVALTNPSMIS